MTYTAEDFRNDTPPRIMGSETEYTTDAIPFDHQFERFLEPGAHYYRENSADHGADLWLENGSRLYLDSSLIEYATPETVGAREVAIHERAGEFIVGKLCQNAAEWMRSQGEEHVKGHTYKRSGYSEVEVGNRFKLLKMSTGHHENYATPLSSYYEWHNHYNDVSLSAYLASRSVWAGAGLVTADGLEFSQKGESTTFTRSSSKPTQYGQKSAYIMHADERLNRLEVRIGDGNMSLRGIERKYAVTSLILRMIEHGSFPQSLQLHIDHLDLSSYNAARNIPVILRDGSKIHPALHQRRILEAALNFADTMPYTPREEVDAALETYEICSIIEHLDHDLQGAEVLADSVDWAAKLTHMREQGVGPINTANLNAVAADLKWEDVAVTGISRKWYEDHADERPDDPAVTRAMMIPPTTRAYARTNLLEALPTYPTIIRWHRIESDGKLSRFNDPYDSGISDTDASRL